MASVNDIHLVWGLHRTYWFLDMHRKVTVKNGIVDVINHEALWNTFL